LTAHVKARFADHTYNFEPVFTFEMVNASSELVYKSAKSIWSSSVPEQFTGRRISIPIIPANENTFKLQYSDKARK